ncbi:acidic amino acid decarboxylase GADL1 [Lepeophtheirus salmonis]|uniref:acidic amino acid decarboxylase GADL1 n=1 Tax=Lepeophtheirus salmonis TaxID=72036 RepID=UPI001AE5E7D0|nr:acidic amino acid decarboxylase GADL1-like [Lepeophtheirus salmonis]XP_040583147.1 acidic amino acid decarboxylase GADL1-like [Lepeophtheirus salmonis]XP_040583148.1 acidic amino acid decarboxylase GADL1-like [Lepeophtheirus salmonis]
MSCNGSTTPEFLRDILELINNKKVLNPPHFNKVVEFLHPKDLEKEFSCLDIDAQSVSENELKEICEKVIDFSIKTNHPYFLNQLYHGVDKYGLAGSWLSDALNTNNHTFEVSPVFTIVEKSLFQFVMTNLLSWNPSESDGIFCPGGSLANMYAMALARYKMFPKFKTEGMYGSAPLVIYTSDEAHYSVVKSANWMGIGTNNVVKVPTDDKGSMILQDLENAILNTKSENKIPFFVSATAGTTVLGGYDDCEGLSKICSRLGLWLHLDACWGGTALLSSKYKYLMKGCDKLDSIAWNPHKMLGSPLQSSLFLVRHKGLLQACNSASATYLFQQDKFYDMSYDTGDKSIQCGRKVDAFKVWFMFKARGLDYLSRSVDNCFDQSRFLYKSVEERSDSFRIIAKDTQCTNVVFIYIPRSLRVSKDSENEDWKDKLSRVPPIIKERLIFKGSLMIGYQPLKSKGWGNCFRLVIHCVPPPTKEDMLYVLDEIDRVGRDIEL